VTVGTLTETLTTYAFTVDLHAEKLTAYDADGRKLAETTFTVPASSGLNSGREWLASLNNWVFNWSVSGSQDNLNEEMCIDNIRAISGDLFN